MYENQLTPHSSVAQWLLSDLERFRPITDLCVDLGKFALSLVDTVGTHMNESCQDEDDSKSNSGEAAIVSVVVDQLLASGLKPEDLAVISPYAAQVQLINSITPRSICANSVDGFQGGEAEVVILSLVRSNTDGECGFLKDRRRLNVAISRARRCCVVVGDTETITQVPYIDDMVTYLCENGNLVNLQSIQSQPQWAEAASKAGYVEFVETIATPVAPAVREISLKEEKSSSKSENQNDQKAEVQKKDQSKTNEDESKCNVTVDQPKKSKRKSKLERKIENSINAKAEIVVTDKTVKKSNFEQLKVDSAEPVKQELPASGVIMATCTQCKKSLPAANMELHSIHCARLMRQKAEEPVEYVQKTSNKKQKQQKKNVKKNPKNRDFEGIDDIDDLLDKAIATAGNCAFGTCKVGVRVMGFDCSTCSKVFCTKHKYPESHGCHASRGAHIPGRSEQIKKKQLQNKLKDKLGDMEKTRKTKSKKK